MTFFFVRKASEALVLWPCDLREWISRTVAPGSLRLRKISALSPQRRAVVEKTMILKFFSCMPSSMRWLSACIWSSKGTVHTCCLTWTLVSEALSFTVLTKSKSGFMMSLQSFCTLGGVVAEKRTVLLRCFGGRWDNILSKSLWKPWSNSWSASSRMRFLRPETLSLKPGVVSRWSRRRPGVATRMSTWLFRERTRKSLLFFVPPITHSSLGTVFRSWNLSSFSVSFLICRASSLVGEMTMVLILPLLPKFVDRTDSTAGIMNARVFPVPVFAFPKMSFFPFMLSGMVSAWMSVRYSNRNPSSSALCVLG
mmetsp:Transcript_20526/g.36475  ORF Transcript_20526/g.36475 Transcript_20526/m.36475 type:complete len:310 (+) Transcript_20526:640-1569(+)